MALIVAPRNTAWFIAVLRLRNKKADPDQINRWQEEIVSIDRTGNPTGCISVSCPSFVHSNVSVETHISKLFRPRATGNGHNDQNRRFEICRPQGLVLHCGVHCITSAPSGRDWLRAQAAVSARHYSYARGRHCQPKELHVNVERSMRYATASGRTRLFPPECTGSCAVRERQGDTPRDICSFIARHFEQRTAS